MTGLKSADEPSIYLRPENDGLPMRRSNACTEIKLGYLVRYLDMFTTAMRKKPWRALHYLDLFSGPGKCRIRENGRIILGSPLLALTLKYPFTRYLFVDNDQKMIEALHVRCNILNNSTGIELFQGDSNRVVNNITEQIHSIDREFIKGKWSSLNLAFLDPEGFEVEWDTMTILARINRIDLIIYYPLMGLNRNMKKNFKSATTNRIDRFFGSQGWRDIYTKYQSGQLKNLHRCLLDFYEDNLEKLDFLVIRENEPLIRNTITNAPMYRLVFASKDQLGIDFWKEAINRDAHGQIRLFK